MDCARNIITANFSGGTSATTAPLWQWDYGQALCITGIDLPAAFEVHFSTNKTGGVSTVAVGADGQVTIPNGLLTIGKNLNAWIYLSDAQGEGETEYSILIPVKARPMPETYDAEVTGEFDDVVRQVSEYAETAQTAADNAGASATAAAASASEAAASALAAESAQTAAETAQGKAEDAQAAAETAAQTATQKAQQTAQDAAQTAQSKADAESAAGRAEAAETGAESAKTDAETAAQGAAASASAASASASSAGQAATSATQSATAAAGSATTAQGAAQTATAKAGEASASSTAAAASETAAQTAQTAAETAAGTATASATTAATKAGEAAQSASSAAQSKTDAEAAATRAETAAATLTVDSALSDTSVNPVQNKVITGEVAQVKSALDGLASDNAITGSVNAVQHSTAFTETLLKDMTFIGGNVYILSLKLATAGWGYCYFRVTGSDLTTRYFDQGIDSAEQSEGKFLFKPDVDIHDAKVIVIRPAAMVDTITVRVECIDPSLYDLVVNDWQENLYVDYDATAGYLTTTGTIGVTDINRTSDFIPVSGKDYLTYQIWNPIPEGDTTKNWTAICFYDSSKNLVGARRTTNIDAQEHEVVTIKVPETAMFARVSFLFRSLDYKCMITYGVYTPAYRKSRSNIIHECVDTVINTLQNATSDDGDDYVLMPGYVSADGNQANILSTAGIHELISEFIPVRPGDVFTFTMTQTSAVSKWMAICQYDANFSMVGTRLVQTPSDSTNVFTLDYPVSNDSAKYIRYSYRSYGGTVTMKVKRTVMNDLALLDKNVDASGILVYDATPFSFTHGDPSAVDADTDTPTINPSTHRVCMTKPVEFSAPVSISAKPGFRAFFYLKSPDGTAYTRAGWQTVSYHIAKNTKFLFVIARNEAEEDTSEVADIAEFASAITFSLPTLNVNDAINNLKERALSDEYISKINKVYDYPGLTPLILSGGYGFVDVVINADRAYLQIPGDTLAVTANGYIQLAPNTVTIDISTNAIVTSAIKVLYNTDSNTFALRAYNGAVNANEIIIATIRRDANNPSISIACPYTLNGSPYGIVNDVNYDKVVKGVNHRGYSTAPENTLPAFKLSKGHGFNYVETDVAFTSDGVPVLLHDSTINRTARNADGTEIGETVSIGSITYEQALTYDFGIYKGAAYAGTKIPTLEQFMSLCRALGLHPYIELKSGTEEQIQRCVDIVGKYGMRDKVSWISFGATRLGYVKDYDSSARLGYILTEITAAEITTAQGLKTTDNEVFIDAIQSTVTDENVALCISADIPLEAWTINSENAVTALNPYVSGMTSDSLIAGKVLYQANI